MADYSFSAKMREAQMAVDRELLELCASAGIGSEDAQSAVNAYRRGRGLNGAEIEVLGHLSASDRSAVLAARYGADGARVAQLIVA